MKIFNDENGKEKVYAQMNDIMFLMNETNIPMPAAIIAKVRGVVIVNDSNRFEFIEFDNKEVIEFFKELEWIIDYKIYINMSDDELESEICKIVDEGKAIFDKYYSMGKKKRKKNLNLIQEHEFKYYKMKFLCEIYALKHGKREMPLPEFILKE